MPSSFLAAPRREANDHTGQGCGALSDSLISRLFLCPSAWWMRVFHQERSPMRSPFYRAWPAGRAPIRLAAALHDTSFVMIERHYCAGSWVDLMNWLRGPWFPARSQQIRGFIPRTWRSRRLKAETLDALRTDFANRATCCTARLVRELPCINPTATIRRCSVVPLTVARNAIAHWRRIPDATGKGLK